MAMSNEDLLKELSAKPIMEVVELVKMLEEEWGVSAAAPVAVAAAGAPGAETQGNNGIRAERNRPPCAPHLPPCRARPAV